MVHATWTKAIKIIKYKVKYPRLRRIALITDFLIDRDNALIRNLEKLRWAIKNIPFSC